MKVPVRIRVKLLVFMFLIIGYNMDAKESKSSDYLKYVNEIVNDFVSYMEKKYQVHCYGSGGSMPTDVEKIEVLFISYNKSTVDDARKMEIDAIQNLLQRINTHEKIRLYLREYPFGIDRVGVTISFRTKTDDYPFDGSIAHVGIGRSKIFYYTAEIQITKPIPLTYMNEKNEVVKEFRGGGPKERLVLLKEEPYEEALKILEESRRSNPK